MKKINAIVGACLYAIALHAAALSLGASRGAVVVGAPVDLSIEIEPDAGIALADSCIEVQLVDGDVPIHSAEVRVTPLPSIPGLRSAVRIRTYGTVREPILLAHVQAGCAGVVKRTYSFLTDIPQGVARPLTPAPAPAPSIATVPPRQNAASTPVAVPAPVSTPTSSVSQRPALVSAPPPAVKTVKTIKAATAPASASVSAPAPKPPASTHSPAPPRLVMEPVETLAKKRADSALAPATGAAAVPAPPPLESQEQRERQERLQAQLDALESRIVEERARSAQLREQLQHLQHAQKLQSPSHALESAPDMSLWVYILGALVALLTGLVLWMGRRMQYLHTHAERAWRDSLRQVIARDKAVEEHLEGQDSQDMWADSAPAQAHYAKQQHQGADSGSMARAPSTMPVSVAGAPENYSFVGATGSTTAATTAATTCAVADVPQTASSTSNPTPPLASTATKTVQIIHPEALFDLLQQAEFFESVGENDQAIEVLKQHIAEHATTSPLSYLELLRLYHQLGRAEDFQPLRMQFMRHFNAEVPAFSGFRRWGRGLEHYVDALAQIEMQWTSPTVVALLQDYLFLRPESLVSVPPFDLAAFNDLLLLLSIAQTVPPAARGKPGLRERTTPQEPPQSPDILAALPLMTPAAPNIPNIPNTPSTPLKDAPDVMLDLNLDWDAHHESASTPPPPITLSDLPPLLATPAPTAGEHIGFGMNDDKFELRFELEAKPERALP